MVSSDCRFSITELMGLEFLCLRTVWTRLSKLRSRLILSLAEQRKWYTGQSFKNFICGGSVGACGRSDLLPITKNGVFYASSWGYFSRKNCCQYGTELIVSGRVTSYTMQQQSARSKKLAVRERNSFCPAVSQICNLKGYSLTTMSL